MLVILFMGFSMGWVTPCLRAEARMHDCIDAAASGFVDCEPLTGTGDSLDYARFAEALRKVFPAERIQDIISKLPPNSKVYGYDVGDISGDSLVDVMMSIRADASPRRELDILLFVQTPTGCDLIAALRKKYVSEPIEVGFAIEDRICRITQKLAEFMWNITGYTVDGRIFRETDVWNTRKLAGAWGNYGMETVDDYRTLRSVETYYRMADARTVLTSRYSTLPALPAGIHAPPVVQRLLADSTHTSIVSGSSSWFGPDDCSMETRATWDSAAVTLDVVIADERILISGSRASTDYLAVDFDLSGKPRISPGGKPRAFAAGERFGLVIPMDFDARAPHVDLDSTAAAFVAARVHEIGISAERLPDGRRRVLLTLPRRLLQGTSVPCTISYHDADNPDHPDWITVMATSDAFEASRPSTYGRLDLLASDASRLAIVDLRLQVIAQRMRMAGLLR